MSLWCLLATLWGLTAFPGIRGSSDAGVPLSVHPTAARCLQGGIDINRADWTLLAALPGVGEAQARRIVASREEQGVFRRVEDLRRVQGIGPRTLEGIRGHVRGLDPEDRGSSRDARQLRN